MAGSAAGLCRRGDLSGSVQHRKRTARRPLEHPLSVRRLKGAGGFANARALKSRHADHTGPQRLRPKRFARPDVASGDSRAHLSAHPGDRGGEARGCYPAAMTADQRRILCDLDGLQDRLVGLSPLPKEAYGEFKQRPPGRSFRSFLLPGEPV
jgi:hypothetical protein